MAAKLPTQIQRLGSEALSVRWNDGTAATLTSKALRTACPCAQCRELRGDTSHDKPLGGSKSLLRVVESSSDEELRLDRIWPIGNYAIGAAWGDGHTTGIYTFEYLYSICQQS